MKEYLASSKLFNMLDLGDAILNNKPQLVVPMSGTGKRFVDAGYHHLKPLINVGNTKMINKVMDMYPGIDDPVFIISKDHKQSGQLQNYLKKFWPNSKISTISEHKLGPGHAVYESRSFIDLDRPVIVSYCDFTGNWDFQIFCNFLKDTDALILTYTGFHPHMLRSSKYAYVQKNIQDEVVKIQEKSSFTDFPMLEEASAGMYAFSKGKLLLRALETQIAKNYSHKGEFYISLTIQPLLEQNLKVKTFLMESFSQFGTPEDLSDWEYLSSTIATPNVSKKKNIASIKLDETCIILAGGIGSRLADFSQIPKPFIKIKNKELWKYSRDASLRAEHIYLVIRKEFLKYLEKDTVEVVKIVKLEKPTLGQADTARLALDKILIKLGPVTFLSCDNFVDIKDYESAISKLEKFDLVIWTSANYPMSKYKPDKYSWVTLSNDTVTNFSLKFLPSNYANANVVIGNFTFKNVELSLELINQSFKSSERHNSEVYLDSVIQTALEFGYTVGAINVDKFFSVGTEDELNIYNYYTKFINFT